MSRYCEKATAELYTYLDQELTWQRRVRIWVHLKRCPPCAHGFDFEDHLKKRIHNGCRDEIPQELYDRLRAFLRENTVEEPPVEGG
jgi:mycothiol system anti-sigma-R factor